MIYNKTLSVEIDSENFYDEIHDTLTSWAFDKEDIEDYPQTLQYLKDYEPEALEALFNNDIDYLEVYRDVF